MGTKGIMVPGLRRTNNGKVDFHNLKDYKVVMELSYWCGAYNVKNY
jgi:hypothetical protein